MDNKTSNLGTSEEFEVAQSLVEAHFYTLRDEIERLREENQALRNLAENLRPGPISQALQDSPDYSGQTIERLRAALERLTNGYKYPAEVCQIAREALSDDGSAPETRKIPPREFDIESHQGLYTEPLAPETLDKRLCDEYSRGWHDGFSTAESRQNATPGATQNEAGISGPASRPPELRSAQETSRKLPPREFDVETHQGLYAEKAPQKTAGRLDIGHYDSSAKLDDPDYNDRTRSLQETTTRPVAKVFADADNNGRDARVLAPPEKASAPREWHFNRYRGQRLMAEGITVHAVTSAEAWTEAESLKRANHEPTDRLTLVGSCTCGAGRYGRHHDHNCPARDSSPNGKGD